MGAQSPHEQPKAELRVSAGGVSASCPGITPEKF